MTTLLIIEDTAAHRNEARRLVEEEALFDEVLEAADGLRGLKLLLQARPDVVLCDLEMPGMNGEKLLGARSGRPDLEHVPFVFMTATGDPRRRTDLFDAGACDVIVKPFHPHDLVARLRLHLRLKQLQDQLLLKNAELEKLSNTDSLTGLGTRRVVEQALVVEVARCVRYDVPLSLLMADLDHFKAVNDEHGHLAGDAVLRGVARILLSGLRASDVSARYGGEEFVALLPHTDRDGAIALAERWRSQVEAERFAAHGEVALRATLSIGVASYGPEAATPDALIAAADRALYAAKSAGRNRVEAAPPRRAAG